MHAIPHSLAHRAAPVTRTRVRWQPYNPTTTQQTPGSKSPTSYLNTPASVSSSSTTSPYSTPAHEVERSRPPAPPSSISSSSDGQSRESQKNRYVMSLVDQAVKSLCDIWKPQDIPTVFSTSNRASVQAGNEVPTTTGRIKIPDGHRNPQLPSPESPNTKAYTLSAPPTNSCSDGRATVEKSATASEHSQCNLVPIKGFVHEVLRRSRTSGGILQTALCYLEAIRPKVSELVRLEKAGEGVREEPDLSSRITVLDDAALAGVSVDGMTDQYNMQVDVLGQHDGAQAQQFEGIRLPADTAAVAAVKKSKSSTPLPPLPSLPSPLLCPRRTFLAALILASKFTQDRCYSNRAWAKLSGLPPREIGRCERALGAALEWRLWVGKAPVSPPAADRTVARCRSDTDVFAGSRQKMGANAITPTITSIAPLPLCGIQAQRLHVARAQSGLRRCATIIVDAPQPPALPLGPALPLTVETMSRLNLSVPRPQCAASLSDSSVPSTPALSDSPSSIITTSSEGEQTIQIQGFVDDSFTSSGCFAPLAEARGFAGKPVSTAIGGYPIGAHQSNAPFIRQEQHAPVYPFASFGGAGLSHAGFSSAESGGIE